MGMSSMKIRASGVVSGTGESNRIVRQDNTAHPERHKNSPFVRQPLFSMNAIALFVVSSGEQ
jgi:hypothetical protein